MAQNDKIFLWNSRQELKRWKVRKFTNNVRSAFWSPRSKDRSCNPFHRLKKWQSFRLYKSSKFLKKFTYTCENFFSFISQDFLWNRWSRNLFRNEMEWLHRRSSSRELGKRKAWPTINMIYRTWDQSYARVTRAIMAGALSRTSFIIPLDPPLPLSSSCILFFIFSSSSIYRKRDNTYKTAARVTVWRRFLESPRECDSKRGSSSSPSRSRLPRRRPPPPWFYKASNGIQLEVGGDLARARDCVSRRDSVGTLTVAAAASRLDVHARTLAAVLSCTRRQPEDGWCRRDAVFCLMVGK